MGAQTRLKLWMFWSWFAAEAPRFRNLLQALARGEADLDDAVDRLARRMNRLHPGLQADLSTTLEGDCRMTLIGGDAAITQALLQSAPRLSGWIFERGDCGTSSRVPFRAAPRPSMDTGLGVSARWEPYAC